MIAGLIYGIYLQKRESFSIDFVAEFTGIQNECFIREIQIELNEKVLVSKEKEQKISTINRFTTHSNAQDCKDISSLWSESVKWFEEYCLFREQPGFDTFLLDSTVAQYELLKRAYIVGIRLSCLVQKAAENPSQSIIWPINLVDLLPR